MMQVFDHIPIGRKNAIPVEHLAKLLGMSLRELRKAVEIERCAGAVILCASDGAGYYRSDDPAEIRKFTRRMISHANSMLAAARSATELADRLEINSAAPASVHPEHLYSQLEIEVD